MGRRTIAVFGVVAADLEALAERTPAIPLHRLGVAALRIGLWVIHRKPELLVRELEKMTEERKLRGNE